MRLSKAFLKTYKEAPKEAEVVSHKLMLRASMIRQLTRGIYSYLPLGYKVLLIYGKKQEDGLHMVLN